MGENRGRRVTRDIYKGPMDKAKEGRIKGGRQGWVGQRGVVRGKWKQLYLDNNNTPPPQNQVLNCAMHMTINVYTESFRKNKEFV